MRGYGEDSEESERFDEKMACEFGISRSGFSASMFGLRVKRREEKVLTS
jgi:hypothetical protein